MNFLDSIINRIDIYDIILLVTLIILLYYKIRGYQSLSYFFYFILTVSFIEIILQVYWNIVFKSNHFIYVVNCMISISYYFYVYYQHFRLKQWALVIKVAFLIWLGLSFLLYDFNIYSKTIASEPYIIGLLLISLLILKYGYDILYVDELRQISKEPLLYFSSGLLFFFVSSFTPILFIKYFVIDLNAPSRITSILSYTNVLLSLGYLSTALCSKK